MFHHSALTASQGTTPPAFQFIPYPNEDIGPAFFMPPYPAAVSPALADLVSKYEDAVLNGPGDDAQGQYLTKIAAYRSSNASDEAMKYIIMLHGQHSGADHDANCLILIDNFRTHVMRDAAERTLCETLDFVNRDITAEWDRLFSEFEGALATEREYDRTVWTPAYDAWNEGGPQIPAEAEIENDRLQEVRQKHEHELLNAPSPDLRGVAIKMLICRDDGRDLDAYDNIILEEARHLTGFSMR